MKEVERFKKRKETVDTDDWYPHSMRLAYFLASNNLPYSVMDGLCWLVQDIVKVSTGKDYKKGYATYSNDQGAREMVRCISKDLESGTISKIKNALYFTLMIDESTDISISKNLVMMARFVESDLVVTKVLDLVYVESGKADCIVEAIETYFEKNSLSFKNLVGFSSDGASKMTGRINGVATQLKKKNPLLIDIHCAAHKLQLAIEESVSDFEQYFIDVVKKTSSYFNHSATRKLALKKCCEDLDFDFYNTLKTVDTRWLSLGNSLKNLMKVYTPLWAIFKDDKESPLAKELFKCYNSLDFKYWVAFMDDICSQLNMLSKKLQASDLNVVELLPKIIRSVSQIYSSFVERSHYCEPLTVSLKSFYQRLPKDGFTDDLIAMHSNCVCFARRIIENISLRFPRNSQQIIDALTFLYPSKLILSGQEANGKAAMELLANHYGSLFDTDTLEFEYQFWKSFILTYVGFSVTSEEFIFAVFKTQKTQMTDFPTIFKLLQISLTLAPGSVDCERAFSLQNIVKTKLRNRLTTDSMADLMRCSRDGVNIKNFDWENHLDTFFASKNRKV